jgi:hypothetical protein
MFVIFNYRRFVGGDKYDGKSYRQYKTIDYPGEYQQFDRITDAYKNDG